DILALSGEVAGGLGVRVEDPWQAEAVAEDVREALGGWPYYVDPWTRTNAQLFSALKLEKFAMGLILSLIILVAAFNIVSTLVMVVVNRTREIGILKAMGLTRRDTLRTFMYQGIWIGAIGTLAGLTLGLTLAFLIERYQLIPFPAEVYFIDRLPVTISVSDVAWIAAVSMLISLLATIYPARQASSLEPVDAIRHE
ncbi:MAG: ABC transporter permease, partial [Gemmatimonadetes bacterium]|nr:ABC transporter permease [Gemmatimonadota bacterium]